MESSILVQGILINSCKVYLQKINQRSNDYSQTSPTKYHILYSAYRCDNHCQELEMGVLNLLRVLNLWKEYI